MTVTVHPSGSFAASPPVGGQRVSGILHLASCTPRQLRRLQAPAALHGPHGPHRRPRTLQIRQRHHVVLRLGVVRLVRTIKRPQERAKLRLGRVERAAAAVAARETLRQIFPTTDVEVVEWVLEANDGDLGKSIEALLEMSSGT